MTSDVPVGIYRTYAYIPPDQPFTYNNWCRALRDGNTFLSAGPIIRLTVNGHPIGDTLQLSGNGGTVEVEASADSTLPIHTLEIVQQGKVVAATEEKSGAGRLSLKTSLRVDGHTWLAARCAGPNYYGSVAHYDGWRRGIMAHTSPVYIACGEEWWMFDQDTAQYITHHHHGVDHEAFLEAPYKQAIEAIHKRMHDLNIPH